MSSNIVDDGYLPTFPPERNHYEGLWKVANPNNDAAISGGSAVEFFRKSGVDKGILRQIWSLSTSTSSLDKRGFFTAVRYIVMVQNGDIPLSKEKLISSADAKFPPPKFVDVQLPAVTPQLPPAEAYIMTPQESEKYLSLFKTYDSDGDGFIHAKAAFPIFMKSGLDPQLLQGIWILSDHDKDNKLNAKEFSVAFHLIICASKKNLPIPPPGCLPPPLLSILAPPNVGQSSTPQPNQIQDNVHSPPVQQTVRPPSPQVHKPLSVDDAFGDLSVDDSPPPSIGSTMEPARTAKEHVTVETQMPVSRPPPASQQRPNAPQQLPNSIQQPSHNHEDVKSLSESVSAVVNSSKRMQAANNSAVETMEKTSGGLKFLMQSLTAEKVSLNAAVSNAESEVTRMTERIESGFNQVAALRAEIDGLKDRLIAAYEHKSSLQSTESDNSLEKQKLQIAIEEGRRELSFLLGEKVEKSRLMGEIGEQISQAQSEYMRITQNITESTSESNSLKAELQLLMSVKSNLQEQHTSVSMEVTQLNSALSQAKNTLSEQREKNAVQEAELARISLENTALRSKVEETLKTVSRLEQASFNMPTNSNENIEKKNIDKSGSVSMVGNQKKDSGVDSGFGTTTPENDDSGFGSGFATSVSEAQNESGFGFGHMESSGFGSTTSTENAFGTTTEFGNSESGFGSGLMSDDRGKDIATQLQENGGSSESNLGDSDSKDDDGGFGSGFGTTTEEKTVIENDGFGGGDDGFGANVDNTTANDNDDFGSGFGSGFGTTSGGGDDGFGATFGSLAKTNNSDDGFGSGFGTIVEGSDDGFGAGFGSVVETNKDIDGFGSTFGSTTETNNDDNFGSGFGTSTENNNTDDGFGSDFGNVDDTENDGFGSAFGTTSTTTKNDDVGNDDTSFGSGFGSGGGGSIDGFGSGFGGTTDTKNDDIGFGSGFGSDFGSANISQNDDGGFGSTFGGGGDGKSDNDDFGSGFGTDNPFGSTVTTTPDDSGFGANFGSDNAFENTSTDNTKGDDGFGSGFGASDNGFGSTTDSFSAFGSDGFGSTNTSDNKDDGFGF